MNALLMANAKVAREAITLTLGRQQGRPRVIANSKAKKVKITFTMYLQSLPKA